MKSKSKFFLWMNSKQGEAALKYFPWTMGQKWLKKEFVENFKKNIGTLWWEKARS